MINKKGGIIRPFFVMKAQFFNPRSTKYILRNIHKNVYREDLLDSDTFVVIDTPIDIYSDERLEHVYQKVNFRANAYFDYERWCNTQSRLHVVKMEKFEEDPSLNKAFTKQFRRSIKDVHVFWTRKTGLSFPFHRDNVHVKLLVLQGQKIVQINGQTHTLNPGHYVDLPKGDLHKVFSTAGTIGLSIGLK